MAKTGEAIIARARPCCPGPSRNATEVRQRPRIRWWVTIGLIGLLTAAWDGWLLTIAVRMGSRALAGRGRARDSGAGEVPPRPAADAGATSTDAAASRAMDPMKPPARPSDVALSPPRPADAPAPPRPEAAPAPPAGGGDLASGRELFATRWVPGDPRCHGGDGLGPLYNATSCLECHSLGGPGGAGTGDRNVEMATGVGYDYMSDPDKPVTLDGLRPMLARNTIHGRVVVRVAPARTDLARIHPGFREASSAVLHRNGVDPAYSRWRADVPSFFRRQGVVISVSARNPPPLFGAGLIAALPDRAFQEAAERQDPGVRGRAHVMKDGAIGRFGWKAQVPTLDEFVLRACANELGLEVPGHHQAASPLEPDARARAVDLTADECRALIGYVRDLPTPIVLNPPGVPAAEGRLTFQAIGCADCHAPELGTIRGIYSDLLLHDMGPGLSDPAAYYGDDRDDPTSPESPTVSEWRTPPLWGFRDSAPYLHDGRAQNLDEAVAWHGGQGTASAHRFRILSTAKRVRVRAFLASLAAPAPVGVPLGPPAAAAGLAAPAGPPLDERKLDAIEKAAARFTKAPLIEPKPDASETEAAGRAPRAASRPHVARRHVRHQIRGVPPAGPGGDNPGVLGEPLEADPSPAGRASVLGGKPTGNPSARPADREAGAGSP